MGIVLKNNARTTLSDAITSLDTTIPVTDTSGFPALGVGDYFYCTIESTTGAYEIVKVTQVNNTTFLAVRAQEDTIAIPFSTGARIELRITVQSLEDQFTGDTAAAIAAAIGVSVQAYDADLTTWAGLTPSANFQTLVPQSFAQMRASLDLEVGVDVQAYDADLATWAGLTPSANAQSLVTAADYAAMRTLLGLVIGTNVQAYDADTAKTDAYNVFTKYQTFVDGVHVRGLDSSSPSLIALETYANGHRWSIMRNTTTESGSNVGSDFDFYSNDDAGALKDLIYRVTRSTGVIDFKIAPTIIGAGILTTASISDTAYDATSWNGVTTIAPSKNAVRDKFAALAQADIAGLTTASSPAFAGLNISGQANFIYNNTTVFRRNDGFPEYLFQGVDNGTTRFYIGANATNTLTIRNGTPVEVLSVTGVTSSILQVTGVSDYGAIYPRGSGTNSSYVFLGNVSNGERARIMVDDSRNMYFSTNGGVVNLVYSSSGQTSFPGSVTIASASAYEPQVTTINTNDDANGGYYILRKTPASDYIRSGDNFGTYLFQGKASGGANVNVAYLSCSATADAGASAINSEFVLASTSGGTIAERLKIRAGLFHGSATGGDQGDATINFKAVYDDGVLLCAPLNPDMTQEDWDNLVPDVEIPERFEIQQVKTGRIIPAKTETRERLDADGMPEEYEHILEPEYEEVLPQKVKVADAYIEHRTHRTARRHFDMLNEGYNPYSGDAYVERMRADKAVPGLPTVAEWRERIIDNGVVDKLSVSERSERVFLALDYTALALADALDRIKILEQRLEE